MLVVVFVSYSAHTTMLMIGCRHLNVISNSTLDDADVRSAQVIILLLCLFTSTLNVFCVLLAIFHLGICSDDVKIWVSIKMQFVNFEL